MNKLSKEQLAKFNAKMEELERYGYTQNDSYNPCPWNDDHECEIWTGPDGESQAEACGTCGDVDRK